jgi:alpha-tubulin suppressor-like RCC1 family protein
VTSWRKFDSALRSGLFLGDNGELYHLPMESSEGSFSPILVQKPAGVTGWLKFCSGGFHHMVIGNNGALYTWGRNWEGQLGVGTTGSDRAIQMVPFPPGVTAWTEVAAGYMHSIAIANDCSLYSWGPNYVGELGLGRQPLQSSPVRVANVQNLCGTPIMFLDGDRSRLEDGSFAVRFDTVLNRTIVIQYSADMQEWFTANGVVNGTGEPITWIDDGPPKTRTHPREDGVRFYRFSFGQ